MNDYIKTRPSNEEIERRCQTIVQHCGEPRLDRPVIWQLHIDYDEKNACWGAILNMVTGIKHECHGTYHRFTIKCVDGHIRGDNAWEDDGQYSRDFKGEFVLSFDTSTRASRQSYSWAIEGVYGVGASCGHETHPKALIYLLYEEFDPWHQPLLFEGQAEAFREGAERNRIGEARYKYHTYKRAMEYIPIEDTYPRPKDGPRGPRPPPSHRPRHPYRDGPNPSKGPRGPRPQGLTEGPRPSSTRRPRGGR